MKKIKIIAVLTALIVLFSLFACTGGEEVHNIEFEVIDNLTEQLLNYRINITGSNACSCCRGLSMPSILPRPETFADFNEIAEEQMWIGRVAVIGDHESILCNSSPIGGATLTTLIVLEQFNTSFVGEYLNPGDLIRVRERYVTEDGEVVISLGANSVRWFVPMVAGEEYLAYLNFFIAREPELIDGEFVYPPYEASVEYAFPVNDREDNRIHQRFEESVFQRSVSLFGTHGANERFAFRDMLANGAREKYLGIAPPASGQPPLETE